MFPQLLYKYATIPFKQLQKRSLFHWINKQFNAVDFERRKLVGPDRTCAEWILRNGGKVKLSNAQDYETDYNNLPEDTVGFKIREIDASNSSVMGNGFEHLRGCKNIHKIILHNCNLLENDCLKELRHVKDSLLFLQVSRCGNITEPGLLNLTILKKLRNLILFDLPYIKDRVKILNDLQSKMTQCTITYDS